MRLKSRPRLSAAISLILKEAGLDASAAGGQSLGIVFVGSRLMREMNRRFLRHDWVTDVIAFDLRGDDPALSEGAIGEILVCPAMAAENALRLAEAPERELMLYIVHGILHLSGFDDAGSDQRAAMEEAQERIMASLAKRFEFKDLFSLDG